MQFQQFISLLFLISIIWVAWGPITMVLSFLFMPIWFACSLLTTCMMNTFGLFQGFLGNLRSYVMGSEDSPSFLGHLMNYFRSVSMGAQDTSLLEKLEHLYVVVVICMIAQLIALIKEVVCSLLIPLVQMTGLFFKGIELAFILGFLPISKLVIKVIDDLCNRLPTIGGCWGWVWGSSPLAPYLQKIHATIFPPPGPNADGNNPPESLDDDGRQ